MCTKFFAIVSMILINWGVLFSQTVSVNTCKTIEKTDEEMELLPWYGNNSFLDDIHELAGDLFYDNNSIIERDAAACPDIEEGWLIPVRFWIYIEENEDELLIPDERDMQRLTDRINFLYNSNGINLRFFMICPTYITDNDMANATNWDAFAATWNGGNSDPNSINVHLVKTFDGGVYNSLVDIIVVDREALTNSGASILAHEIGHYFGLEHTHRGSEKGKCGAECVSRSRNFPAICFPRTGKMCEKNGDGLCDTPADPKLSSSKVNSDCIYTTGEVDAFGDVFTPDERNIMSYTRQTCRDAFSVGQINSIAYSLLTIRTDFQTIDANETDPDKYEPDDTDFPGVPRTILVGETQCHSFYDMIECQDPVDWLVITQGVIGNYRIIVEDVSNSPYPVETIRVWHIGSDLRSSSEVQTTISTFGALSIVEFPCSEFSFGLLVEVVRKSDVTEGKYTISLTSTSDMSIEGSDLICNGASFSVNNLPLGANVIWTSSPNITLGGGTTNGTTVINSFVSGTPPYWIEATVVAGGCVQTIRKSFSGLDLQDFFIVPETPACYPGTGLYSISSTANGVTYNWTCQGTPCGTIIPLGNGEAAQVLPDGTGAMTLVVTAQDVCGNTLTKTKAINVGPCRNQLENIIIAPNPTTSGIIDITIQDTYLTEGTYLVFVANQMSEIKYQGEKTTKQFSLNLSELPNGIFYLHLYREEISGTASFVINK
ncbi:MAG: M43 family zinc metalloprotease [Saprospiraceae bacterium]|nr:M43 family zinc metalloprotease [Saprospiraceae bacterium]